MEITRRTDYAVRIMRCVAEYGVESPVSVRAISEADNVPYQFARRISYDLAGAGLIKVTRGARGGAMLAKPAEKITLYDIVKVGQGDPICSRCSLAEQWCEHENECMVRDAWKKLDKIVSDYLKSVKLTSLVPKRSKSKSAAAKPTTKKAAAKPAAKPAAKKKPAAKVPAKSKARK
ncbi:MAG: Rrf2 family transcriptional regulator [Actinomycetes bacterium]|jgi:Rrf2 family protein|nr:Rrf2 family transcriptional regulator [Actinomycetes bacterium]